MLGTRNCTQNTPLSCNLYPDSAWFACFLTPHNHVDPQLGLPRMRNSQNARERSARPYKRRPQLCEWTRYPVEPRKRIDLLVLYPQQFPEQLASPPKRIGPGGTETRPSLPAIAYKVGSCYERSG